LGRPHVSFAVASYNSDAFLREAVASALAQRGVEVEVLIVDDHSADGSDALAQTMAAEDPRVVFLRTPRNSGPAGARNVALDHARGDWFAILDSDDLLHPDRSARLLAEAAASGADMIADDLLLFDDDRAAPCRLFLDADRARGAQWITLPAYLDETRIYGKRPNLGFLKPMIRRDFLGRHAIRYDEELRVAEDDALILACLGAGARYRLVPQPLYFYRKHGSSISHRLQTAHVDRMKAASDRLLAAPSLLGPGTRRPLRRRAAAMRRAWAFTHLIDALQQRRAGRAARLLLTHPGALPLLRMPIGARVRRWLPARAAPLMPKRSARPTAVIVEAGDGSTAMAQEIREAGFDVHVVRPSPTTGPHWAREDLLRVANHAALRPDLVVADGASAAEALPYLLAPHARSAVIGQASEAALDDLRDWLVEWRDRADPLRTETVVDGTGLR
jgi:succinoglycan biosynthesis protein ExoO